MARTNGTENRIVRGCVGGVGRIAQRMHTIAWIQWASRGRSEAVKAKKIVVFGNRRCIYCCATHSPTMRSGSELSPSK